MIDSTSNNGAGMENQENFSPKNENPLDSLQFQKAEVPAGAAGGEHPCASCSRGIANEYYQLEGVTICPDCAAMWRRVSAKPPTEVLIRGSVFGAGAALASAAGMALINWFTDWRLALLAIAAGWLVGTAFRKGTGGMGSRTCQILAVVFTYFAITMSEIPTGIRAIMESQTAAAESVKQASGDKTPTVPAEAQPKREVTASSLACNRPGK